jgi:hypothetical protein
VYEANYSLIARITEHMLAKIVMEFDENSNNNYPGWNIAYLLGEAND